MNSGGKAVFQKKPLGRRRHLMSSFARSGTASLVSATSGTERERGFAGILPCRSVPFEMLHHKFVLQHLNIKHHR